MAPPLGPKMLSMLALQKSQDIKLGPKILSMLALQKSQDSELLALFYCFWDNIFSLNNTKSIFVIEVL